MHDRSVIRNFAVYTYLHAMNDKRKLVTQLRIAYPIWAVTGMFSILFVPSQLIDLENATRTAEQIASNALLFRLGIAMALITQLLFILVPFLLYHLFRDVNKSKSLAMLLLALVAVPIAMLNEVSNFQVLQLLDQPEQLMHALESHQNGLNIATIFWGLWLFPLGCLVKTSGYFPKVFGYFLIAAGVGYLISAFAKIILPELPEAFMMVEILTMGEVIFLLWLMVRGAKLE